MTASRPPLSVIVPLLNEERSLEELHARIAAILPRDGEVIYVDDGSTDGSSNVLAALVASDARVRALRFRRNFGKSVALAAGFRQARGEVIATIDADLQEDPADISRLADKLAEGYDLVGAWRRRRRDAPGKVFASRVFNRLVGWFGGKTYRDINCGLKVMRRQVIEEVRLATGFHRFLPLLAHWRGFRTVEVEVAHEPRRYGRSRYRGDRFFRGFLDLAVILFLVRYEGRPGRYFVGSGALLGAVGFVISAYIAYLRLSTGSIQSRYPLLGLGLVLMVVGVQLFSLGLFGELLAYHFRSRLPQDPFADEIGRDAEAPASDTAASVGERRSSGEERSDERGGGS